MKFAKLFIGIMALALAISFSGIVSAQDKADVKAAAEDVVKAAEETATEAEEAVVNAGEEVKEEAAEAVAPAGEEAAAEGEEAPAEEGKDAKTN